MPPPDVPKVFVSHASEDKERFVLRFAQRLRERGVDAWLDKWEMGPGDSLVDKIFEEGLKEAQAVIVVLSPVSVNKPWVREELNVGLVKRINQGSKLIPVVIEDCEVPEALKSTLWERIGDLDNYHKELDRIVDAIYGHSEKPPLGPPPAYTQTLVDVVPGLTPRDAQILVFSCEETLNLDPSEPAFLRIDDVFARAAAIEIGRADFEESLEILGGDMYLELKQISGKTLVYSVTDYGLEEYARACIPNYSSIVSEAAFQLVNNELRELDDIAAAINQSPMLTNHILKQFRDRQLISAPGNLRYWCGFVIDVSVRLRRMLRDGELGSS